MARFDFYKYKGHNGALDYIQQIFGGFNDQIRETKPLTEQENIATINNIQTGTSTTGQY